MGFERVAGDGLFTRYSDSPTVTVRTFPEEAPTDLQLEFPSQSSHAGSGERYRRTRITFKSVWEYRWIITDFVYYPTDPDAHAFALIEVFDSGLKQRLIEHSKYRSLPAGDRLGGVVKEADLRHFRIGFDHHGAYEVLCLGVQIDYIEGIA
jgi:hypothetical protein